MLSQARADRPRRLRRSVAAWTRASWRERIGRAGLRTPATARCGAEAVAAFPGGRGIVKERVHGPAREHGRLAQLSPVISSDASAIARAAERVRAAGGEPVIQEHVAGDVLAFCSVRALDGRLVARVQQVGERVWPRDRGLSVRARTVAVVSLGSLVRRAVRRTLATPRA